MTKIKTFSFEEESLKNIKNFNFGRNWPIVYIIEDGKEVYIGETINGYNRMKDHYKKEERKKLENVHFIYDKEYNKSATLDTESWLIQYMAADGVFSLQNKNKGLKNHDYYDKTKYRTKFEIIWEKLKKKKITKQKLINIRNSDLFKYSPYKRLTDNQVDIVEEVLTLFKKNQFNTYLIKGKPGTGKTVLATYLFKALKDRDDELANLKIGLVIPQTSLRSSIKKVFKNIKNLKANMVIGPSGAVKKGYDVLIVDEAHRLKRRKNITNYGVFDKNNQKLGLGEKGDQLDWILRSVKKVVLLYDQNQSVRPSDVRAKKFKRLKSKNFELKKQVRVEGGGDYIKAINNFLELRKIKKTTFPGYSFKMYTDARKMVNDIKNKNKKEGLSRVIAGYAWPWKTKNNKKGYDFEIDNYKFKWNSTTSNWINTEESINEVGCIHTIQGYDLNYAGVIVGPEISYDFKKEDFVVNKENYYDRNGYVGVEDMNELKRYIINIYKVLLTRGIKGTYVYIVDDNLRKYFEKVFGFYVKN